MLLLCKYFFELYCYLHAIFLDTVLFVTEDILSEFTILENLSYNLNKFTCNISDTQNFTFLEFEHTCISSPFFFFPFNSRHTYPIRSSFAAQTRFIHLYNFILLFLSRFFFNTCSRGNSIWKFYVAELDRESYSRVYSSLFDPKE